MSENYMDWWNANIPGMKMVGLTISHQYRRTLGKNYVNSPVSFQQGDGRPAQWLQHYGDGAKIEKLNCRYIQFEFVSCQDIVDDLRLLQNTKHCHTLMLDKSKIYMPIAHKSWLVRREQEHFIKLTNPLFPTIQHLDNVWLSC